MIELAENQNNGIVSVAEMEKEIAQIRFEMQNIDYAGLEKSSDDIDECDSLTAIIIGFAGAALTTSEKISAFLDDIHTDASLVNPKTFMGKLLHHSGDVIDRVARGGKGFATYLHRLYGGHDILSFGHGDNPFVLLCRQYGIPKGILQALRHLVADTFSKNGGVLPGSSFLDFTKDDGSVGNLLDEWAKAMSKSKGFNPQTVYAQLFSIHFQNFGSIGVVDMLLKAYERKRFSKVAKSQLRIIALLTMSVVAVAIGMDKHNMIPKVNIPAVAALVFEVGHLLFLDSYDVRQAEARQDSLDARLALLEKSCG